MDRQGKISFIELISTTVLFFILTIGSFFAYTKEHSENLQLKEQVETLTKDLSVMEDKYNGSKKVATELQLKIQEFKTQINGLTMDLEQEKSGRQDAESKLEQSRADLEQQKTSRADLEEKLSSIQDEGKKIRAQIKDLEKQKSDLELKIKDLESANKIELGKVVVNSDTQGKSDLPATLPAPSVKTGKAGDEKSDLLEGKVLVVNKEFNFIVFNLGNKDRIQVGDEFGVYHENKLSGTVKVEKVHDSMSAAGFTDDYKNRFFENDIVIQKAK